MIAAMRSERDRILAGVAQLGNLGLKPAPLHSPEHDCATQVILTLPSAPMPPRPSPDHSRA